MPVSKLLAPATWVHPPNLRRRNLGIDRIKIWVHTLWRDRRMLDSIPWMSVCHFLGRTRAKRFRILNWTKKQYVQRDLSWTPYLHQSRIDSPDTNSSISSLNTTVVKLDHLQNAFLWITATVRGMTRRWSDVHLPNAFFPIFTSPSPRITVVSRVHW